MTNAFIPWLFAGIPFAGALVCLSLWSDAYRVKMSAIVWSVISFASIVGLADRLPTPSDGLLPLYLLPLALSVY